MKLFRVVYLLFAAIIVLSGCQSNTDNEKNEAKQESKEKVEYKRIISLIPSNTEILYELGLGDKVVGVSTVDDYPKDVKDKKQFDAFKLDTEALMKAKPDLILAHESNKSTQEKDLKKLTDAGVKVVYIDDANSINEMYQTFKQVGKVTGKEKEANKLVDKVKNDIEKVKKDIPEDKQGKQVFMEISSQPDIYTSGKNTFYDDMLTSIKAKNVFHDEEGWIKTDKESILKRNPDVMITTSGQSEEEYKKLNNNRDGFDQVNAVKNDSVYALNADKISRPGPRLAEGLEELADKIYD
ncbi:ABC transporter substrate-binding protein [Mammaliicoccus lentus]|uniref:ABC transporter substrate-binding protein n=1 Tax=Mammaliicoccus TaxID=2803850 RepID=UPI00085BFEE8|nr:MULTISPECIES: ABC transporter substrate-binding protein [Mammaliicoccus]MBW0770100.1 ABC transporter substrate-binding protein [Mammaliicoccus lentus]MCD2478098.1 ABC transporter substrate-binding protein [Mammaliicoccus lentus]MCD2520809.1 ABC transporter substrate-binding protein [Mammaliicoccus lentus]MCR1872921.1 ABC transporter substrate-binding protein [Mammaliicoccus lentus]SCU19388.1 iron ABC transporter substrate-binding protein [Mammaliicoccus lentus]